MKILGIESTCDETGVAIVHNGSHIEANIVASQADLHAAYGGVVPEVAARNHIEQIIPVMHQALTAAGVGWDEIDGIAVASHPGLLGSLLIGTLTAKTLAITKQKPLYSVNHVLAHVQAAFLDTSKPPQFPLLALIVSGGHTLLVHFSSHLEYEVIGGTRDDAAGEAFDKVAKLLGLAYPGGPNLSRVARSGNPKAFDFPQAKLGHESLDFSFSGLKTAVLRQVQHLAGLDYRAPSHGLYERLRPNQIADIAASFEQAVVSELVTKLKLAANKYAPRSIVVAGGVAANAVLRQSAAMLRTAVHFPPPSLSTDNAAMIAAAGEHLARAGLVCPPEQLEATPTLNLK